MKIKSWLLSLMFPLISIAAAVVLLIFDCAFFTAALGFIVGGLVPLLIICIGKADLSPFIVGKLIMTGVLIVGIILSWTVLDMWLSDGPYHILYLPIAMLIAELIFANTREEATARQKAGLFFSSPTFVYFGVVLDILGYFSAAARQ